MRSHAVGVGANLDDAIVRLVMLMKVVALAEGFSGVRPELVETLCALINAEIYPLIPSRGSVGARTRSSVATAAYGRRSP